MSLFSNNLTMKTLNMLEKGMSTSILRRRVLADNISNVSVPHFKRSEVSFEADLKRAVQSEAAARHDYPLMTDDPLHLKRNPFRVRDYQKVQARVHLDHASAMRNDGNNVDMEDEAMKLVRNQMRYALMAQSVGSTFRQMNHLLRMA